LLTHGAAIIGGMKRPVITPPTLGQMRQSAPWLWLHCLNSQYLHHAPIAMTPLIIRWGPHTSADRLRASARCTSVPAQRRTTAASLLGGQRDRLGAASD